MLAPALEAILSGQSAETVLDRVLRAHRHLSADQRRVTAEALFGVGLWRRRLRAHAGPDAPPLVLLGVLARDLGQHRAVSLDVTLPSPAPPPDDWRDRWSIPDWLADVLHRVHGPDAPLAAEALCRPGPVTLRANRRVTTRDALAHALADEGRRTAPARLAPDALHVTTRPANLTATTAWQRGWFEIQDEGSQLLAEAVPARDGDTVLDLCAGAGGKTLALASRLPAATLHAFDTDRERLSRLRARASRATARVHVHLALPEDLRVHHVLVDAPCSELGALRRGPDLRWRLPPDAVTRWPPAQRELLRTAARHVLPGGALVYATCTVTPDENDAVVTSFLAEDPRFTLEPVSLPLCTPDGCLRLSPHVHGTDGFFAAVLRRAA
ncbi:MAG: RsmB/NOP family class I SAM-dependent RNA methyltransferase [Myxococcaceae bacterium]|nr:RsmB/NOP family class I SAM-dependent RNA methyltransferase [Myxococcaceae bacterium]MCA3016088.1 RsmB/NOP family class I SAM-dependent RNA methyltransferase [Myxococcaceae bacterium]